MDNFLTPKLFALLKVHVGICGFQFPEFLDAWQVELLDPDRLYSEEHEKVATVSKGYAPLSRDVV